MTRRDLPIPVSPVITITRGLVPSVGSPAAQSSASSASRPRNGNAPLLDSGRVAVSAPSANACTGFALALDAERFERARFELRRRTIEHGRAREELARTRGGHESRREIHGIAHDRVRRSEPCADLDGEHVAAVHADAHRQLLVGIDDGAAPRSMRPSSSSRATGTPAARITLPPSASRSVARNVTDSASTARCTAEII